MAVLFHLPPPAPRPLGEARGEEKLQVSLREDHRAGVPAFRHHPAPRADGPLLPDQGLPDPRNDGDPGGGLGNLRPADLLRDILPVEKNPDLMPRIHPERHPGASGQSRENPLVGEGNPLPECLQGHGPIHGSGIEIQIAQALRQKPGGRGFAGSSGAVDRDDKVLLHRLIFRRLRWAVRNRLVRA